MLLTVEKGTKENENVTLFINRQKLIKIHEKL